MYLQCLSTLPETEQFPIGIDWKKWWMNDNSSVVIWACYNMHYCYIFLGVMKQKTSTDTKIKHSLVNICYHHALSIILNIHLNHILNVLLESYNLKKRIRNKILNIGIIPGFLLSPSLMYKKLDLWSFFPLQICISRFWVTSSEVIPYTKLSLRVQENSLA